MTNADQTIDQGADQLAESFEGSVTDDDLTESLSSENAFSWVLNAPDLEPGVKQATVTRTDFDADREVCQVYYSLGNLEWVTEFDPRDSDDVQDLRALFAHYNVDTDVAANLVGRSVTVIVEQGTVRLVTTSSVSHEELVDAYADWKLGYFRGAMGYRPLLATPVYLGVALALVAAVAILIPTVGIVGGLLLTVLGVSVGITNHENGLGGPSITCVQGESTNNT